MGFKIENGVLLEWTPEEGETTVNVPDGVTEIQEHAFWECTGMKRIPVIALDGKVFAYLAERDDRETLSQLLEEGNYITRCSIEKYLETARDMGQLGIVGLLDDYQKAHLA